MQHDNSVLAWLLQADNPAVRLRAQTELLGAAGDKQPVIDWLQARLPVDWRDRTGLWRTYFLTAIAECGLSLEDVGADREAALLLHGGKGTSENSCGDMMHLRALVRLGFGHTPAVREALTLASARQLPDGGFLCLHRLDKLCYTPKSCVKANLHALLLAAECKKRGIDLPYSEDLLAYFWRHRLFYRTARPDVLMLDCRAGWRTIDTFYPFEVMRVGLQNVVEAFAALGLGADARLQEAWALLDAHRDEEGKYRLGGTLTKSYLPKERVGQPSKWVTLYALLAHRASEGAGAQSKG